jgi:hypothetical protein
MSPPLYQVSIGVPSGALVAPTVRPRTSPWFTTKDGRAQGAPAAGAGADRSPSIGVPAAKKSLSAPRSGSSVGSAPSDQPVARSARTSSSECRRRGRCSASVERALAGAGLSA